MFKLLKSLNESFLGMKGISAARFNNIFRYAILHTFKVQSENDITAQKVREVSASRIARILITHMSVNNKFIFVVSGTAAQKSHLRNIIVLSNIKEFVNLVVPGAEPMGSYTEELYILTGTRKNNDGIDCKLVKANSKDIVNAIKEVAKHSLVSYNITVSDEKKEQIPFLLLDLLPIFLDDENENVENTDINDIDSKEETDSLDDEDETYIDMKKKDENI